MHNKHYDHFQIPQDSHTILVSHIGFWYGCSRLLETDAPGKPSESITPKTRACRDLPTAYPTRDLGPTAEGDIPIGTCNKGLGPKYVVQHHRVVYLDVRLATQAGNLPLIL